jgi:plasmid maintenance system killer protein
MDIQFAGRKLEKECNDGRLLERRHGTERAKLLKRRLTVLGASPNLAALGPPNQKPLRCHELTGDRKGQLSVDLDHPYRLIFVPMHDPLPQRAEGGLDWEKVTAIEIIEIADTHE